MGIITSHKNQPCYSKARMCDVLKKYYVYVYKLYFSSFSFLHSRFGSKTGVQNGENKKRLDPTDTHLHLTDHQAFLLAFPTDLVAEVANFLLHSEAPLLH